MTFSQHFSEALTFAAELHATQCRKGTEIPYIAHLLGVASIAMEHGATEDEAIAALLHDAVEDHGPQQRPEIERRFGPAVLAIVEGCTDTDQVPKPPWKARKEAYIAHVRAAPASVALVSASDKLHNARAILQDYRLLGESLWKRFNGGKEGTLWYYRELIKAFRGNAPQALVGELDRVVSDMAELASANAGAGAG